MYALKSVLVATGLGALGRGCDRLGRWIATCLGLCLCDCRAASGGGSYSRWCAVASLGDRDFDMLASEALLGFCMG